MSDRSQMLAKVSQDEYAAAQAIRHVLGHLEELATEIDMRDLAFLIGVAYIAAADAANSVKQSPAGLTLVHDSAISDG